MLLEQQEQEDAQDDPLAALERHAAQGVNNQNRTVSCKLKFQTNHRDCRATAARLPRDCRASAAIAAVQHPADPIPPQASHDPFYVPPMEPTGMEDPFYVPPMAGKKNANANANA